MKVAVLTYSLRPRGGVVHALNLAEALVRRRMDVRLFSLRKRDSAEGQDDFFRKTTAPTTIIDFDWDESTRARLESMVNALISSLPCNYDIYHAQDCVCDTVLQKMVERDMIMPPTLRTVHHIEGFPDPYLRQCEVNVLRADSVKITVSEYWQKKLEESYGIRSSLIHNGIDLNRFPSSQAREQREQFILFVGGMEARKGLEIAIETLEILRRRGRDLRLIAIAKPGFRGIETRAWFDHLVERCGLNGKVDIIEGVDEEQLMDLYSRASIFLLPTRMEGWGLAIMEAMAAGCPVISSPVGGVPELVRDGENGLLVDYSDRHGLAEAVERYLDDPELVSRIRVSARESIEKFTWESTAAKTEELYLKILERRKLA